MLCSDKFAKNARYGEEAYSIITDISINIDKFHSAHTHLQLCVYVLATLIIMAACRLTNTETMKKSKSPGE